MLLYILYSVVNYVDRLRKNDNESVVLQIIIGLIHRRASCYNKLTNSVSVYLFTAPIGMRICERQEDVYYMYM